MPSLLSPAATISCALPSALRSTKAYHQTYFLQTLQNKSYLKKQPQPHINNPKNCISSQLRKNQICQKSYNLLQHAVNYFKDIYFIERIYISDLSMETQQISENLSDSFGCLLELMDNQGSENYKSQNSSSQPCTSINITQKYKCFKCYGTNKDNQMENQKQSLCAQCQGANFITQSHFLPHILEQVLMVKYPTLSQESQSLKKIGKKSYTAVNNQKSHRQIYFDEDIFILCVSCHKQYDENNILGCEYCRNFFVCFDCFLKEDYIHPNCHSIFSTGVRPISLRLKPTTIDKIQEQQQFQDDFFQPLRINCFQCDKLIQQVYQFCVTCEKVGKQFIVCPECSKESIDHQPFHQFDIRTLPQARLMQTYKPYGKVSQVTESTPIKQTSRAEDSINKLEAFELGEQKKQYSLSSKRLQDRFAILRHSWIMPEYIISPLSYLQKQMQFGSNQLPNLRGTEIRSQNSTYLSVNARSRRQEQSVINIDMEQSIQIPPQSKPSSMVFPAAFSSKTTKNNIPQQYLFNYQCDICSMSPIKNRRYHCRQCEDYDICEGCYFKRSRLHEHKNYQLFDGLEALKKNIELMMTKMGSSKNRISGSRQSIGKTHFSQFNSFKE